MKGRRSLLTARTGVVASELARVIRKGGRIALTTWLSDSNLFKLTVQPITPT